MTTLRLLGLSGEIPKLLPRLLPENAAQIAFNSRLDDGGLTPVRKSKLVSAIAGAIPADGYKTIYKYGDDWLAWGTVVNAVPGPVAQDRLYYTGDGAPKMRVGTTVYGLEVPAPSAGLTATVGGTPTSTEVTSRLYVYTNVTQFGEESEPSPVSNEVNWRPGNNVTLSGFSTTMGNGRTASTQRIYRSQTSLSGTTLYLIVERTASTANYVDTIPVSDIGEPLPSRDWNAPPDGLAGLISLPNGMMAAFMGKDLYFCEPFRPHAWPEKYILTTEYPIVGLGSYGNTLAVMTSGNPYVVSGTAPENMVMEKLELNLPCVNARGIVDLGYAVAYPSHEGLVLVSPGGARIVTEQLLTREDWLQLNPHTMVSGQRDGRYYASYRYADVRNIEQEGTLILDMSGEQPFVLRSSTRADAFFYEITTGSLYYVLGANISELDAIGAPYETQSWRSKQFFVPKPVNFGAILVEAESELTDKEIAALEAEAAEIEAENEVIYATGDLGGALAGAAVSVYAVNGDALQEAPVLDRTVNVNIYADGELRATVTKINQMARLPSGFLARRWEVEVVSNTPVAQVSLAQTGAELMTL